MHINSMSKHFLAPQDQDHRWPQSLKLSVINFVIFRKILQKTLNFNCDFLKEGIRYLTFPVDFLKAQTIVFHENCSHFSPISLLLGVKLLQNNEGHLCSHTDVTGFPYHLVLLAPLHPLPSYPSRALYQPKQTLNVQIVLNVSSCNKQVLLIKVSNQIIYDHLEPKNTK